MNEKPASLFSSFNSGAAPQHPRPTPASPSFQHTLTLCWQGSAWPSAHDGSPCGCGQVLESAHVIVVAVVDLALNMVVVVVVVAVPSEVRVTIGESAAANVVVRTLAGVGPAGVAVMAALVAETDAEAPAVTAGSAGHASTHQMQTRAPTRINDGARRLAAQLGPACAMAVAVTGCGNPNLQCAKRTSGCGCARRQNSPLLMALRLMREDSPTVVVKWKENKRVCFAWACGCDRAVVDARG